MKGARLKKLYLAEYVGKSLLDFGHSGEKGRLNRRLTMGINNFKDPNSKNTLKVIKTIFTGVKK